MKRRLHRLVAQSAALVGLDALFLRLDVGHAVVPSKSRLGCVKSLCQAPDGGQRLFRLPAGPRISQSEAVWPAETARVVQHVMGEPSNLADRDRQDVTHRLADVQTVRRHLRRLQQPGQLFEGLRRDVRRARATSAARTRASSPSLLRPTPPSWKPAPTRSAARSSTRASRSRCPARSAHFRWTSSRASSLRPSGRGSSGASRSGSRPSSTTSTTSTASRRSCATASSRAGSSRPASIFTARP